MESRQSRRRNRRTEDRKEYRSPLGPYLRTILVAVVIALLLRTLVVFAVAVEGPSMEPTLHTSDVVRVEKVSLYFGAPNRMDIVIVEYPNRSGLFVKRVIGLPGETLEVREGNAPAIALYEKLGFREVGRRKNYYPESKEDAVLMTVEFRGE